MSVFDICLGTVVSETYKYLSVLCEVLESVSILKTISFPLANVCASKLPAPDYLYLRRSFRWDWRPEFNVQTLIQV